MIYHYQSGFALGEISESFQSNIDAQSYNKSVKKAVNVFFAPQGSATRRKGAKALSTIDDEERWALVEFSIDITEENYIVCFFSNKIIVYSVENETEFVINSQPYTREQIRNVAWAQLSNVVVFAGGIEPYILEVLDDNTFSFRKIEFLRGPSLDENRDRTLTITASVTGPIGAEVTLTSSADIFDLAMVGGIWALSEVSGGLASYTLWELGQTITAGQYRVRADNLYRATTSGTTGSFPPSHDADGLIVSDGGVSWLFLNKGSGYVKTTEYISPTQMKGIIQRELPPSITPTVGTSYWNEGAWSDYRGYPVAVTLYKSRLVFGGSDQSALTYATPNLRVVPRKKQETQRIWASVLNQYFVFDTSGPSDPTKAIAVDLVAKKSNKIRWLSSGDTLLVGTDSGIFPILDLSLPTTAPSSFTSRNISYSVSSIQPLLLNDIVIFCQFDNFGLQSASFNENSSSFRAQSITFRNEELFKDLVTIGSINRPTNQAVCLKKDGTLAILYFDIQQEVVGAYSYQIDGEKITSMCTLKSEIYIGTESGKFGVISEKNESYLDFGKVSEAFLLTLPVGVAASGQIIGFNSKDSLLAIEIKYYNTQGFAVNDYTESAIPRLPLYEQSEAMPFTDGYVISTLKQNNEVPIKIKSVEAAGFTIASLKILYTLNQK